MSHKKTGFLSQLLFFTSSYHVSLMISFGIMSLGTLISLAPPYIIISLINKVIIPIQNGNPKNLNLLPTYFIELTAAAFLTWVCSFCKTYLLASISEKVTAKMRTVTFDHILSLSLDFFNQKRLGELISRIGNETENLNFFISLYLLDFIQDCILVIMILIIMFKISTLLTLVTLIPIPFVLLIIFLLKNKMYEGFEKSYKLWSELVSFLSDVIRGIRVVKSFAQEKTESKKFLVFNQKFIDINNQANRIWASFTPTGTLFNDLSLILIWGFGIKLMLTHQTNLGELTGFVAYSARLYARFETLSRFTEQYKRARVSLNRIFEILNYKSNLKLIKNPIYIDKIEGNIRVENISFNYFSKKILDDISFNIKSGEKVAIVGHSGAGKTSLMNLLCRFFDPNSGTIYVDDIKLNTLDLESYHNSIGIVLQENFLFYGTIAENIAYGNPKASIEEITEAAKLAHCHQFIMEKPDGYQTLLFENGVSLSGGERQRVAIARAILSKPDILFLDEATSAIDIHTEHEIQQAIDNLTKNKTSIVISHRLSSLPNYDKIIFLDKGKLLEIGNHYELMANKRFYYDFYEKHYTLHKDILE